MRQVHAAFSKESASHPEGLNLPQVAEGLQPPGDAAQGCQPFRQSHINEFHMTGAGHVEFVYVGLPKWLAPLRRIPRGLQAFCYLWQIQAFRVARRLLRERRVDLTHHLTYANDWMANFIGAWVPLPYLRGPGG